MMKVITTNGGLESRFGYKESIRIIKEAGFDGYVTKPVRKEQLFATINALIRERKEEG